MIEVLVWFLRLFQRPVRPGSAIMLERSLVGEDQFGTYGCMVMHVGTKYMLSCAHVFGRAQKGEAVICVDWRASAPIRTVVDLSTVSHEVDFALVKPRWSARVLPEFPRSVGRIDPTPFAIDSVSFVRRTSLVGRVHVQALGAVSDHAEGFAATGVFSTLTYVRTAAKKKKVVHDKSAEYTLSPPFIEIKPDVQRTLDFCKKGDSGALLLTAPERGLPQPLGLLVGLRKDGLGDFGLAVPIQRVLDEIGADARVYTGGR